jgi:ferredoxin-NADP reductase
MSIPTLNALVYAMRYEADGIVSIELRPATPDVKFSLFDAGSHIDLHLPNGLVRSYSLCNSVSDSQRYVVGVLNERKSRGGSSFVHQQLRVGTILPISTPRNSFKLDESAEKTVLVAGGVGVTPIWCMLQHLDALGKSAELIYCARTRKDAAFCDAIEAMTIEAATVHWHFDDVQGAPPDLTTLLAGRGADSHYYCCGPPQMLDAFEKACEKLGYFNVHVERFAAVQVATPVVTESFIIDCVKSGKKVEVPYGKSILDSLLDAGLDPDYSCKEGICGACETVVLSGEIVHRDSVLSQAERASNMTMMICVSGCARGPLVLEI